MTQPTRTPLMWSGGSPSGADCTGSFQFDFNALIQSHTDMRLTAGRTVYTQFWYRDGGSASGTGLSNATSFAIAP